MQFTEGFTAYTANSWDSTEHSVQQKQAHQVWRMHRPQPQVVQAVGRLLVELVVGAGLATGQPQEAGDLAAGCHWRHTLLPHAMLLHPQGTACPSPT